MEVGVLFPMRRREVELMATALRNPRVPLYPTPHNDMGLRPDLECQWTLFTETMTVDDLEKAKTHVDAEKESGVAAEARFKFLFEPHPEHHIPDDIGESLEHFPLNTDEDTFRGTRVPLVDRYIDLMTGKTQWDTVATTDLANPVLLARLFGMITTSKVVRLRMDPNHEGDQVREFAWETIKSNFNEFTGAELVHLVTSYEKSSKVPPTEDAARAFIMNFLMTQLRGMTANSWVVGEMSRQKLLLLVYLCAINETSYSLQALTRENKPFPKSGKEGLSALLESAAQEWMELKCLPQDEIDEIMLTATQMGRPLGGGGGVVGGWAGAQLQQNMNFEALQELDDVPTPLPANLLLTIPRRLFRKSRNMPPGSEAETTTGQETSDQQPTTASPTEAEEAQCTICVMPYDEGDDVATLPDCRHEFHWDCVSEWFQRKKHCCVCKVEVGTQQQRQPPQAAVAAEHQVLQQQETVAPTPQRPTAADEEPETIEKGVEEASPAAPEKDKQPSHTDTAGAGGATTATRGKRPRSVNTDDEHKDPEAQ